MIPMGVAIHGPQGRERRYYFEVARSRSLTPGLASATIVSSISEALFDVGLATTRYDLTYWLNGGARELHREPISPRGAATCGPRDRSHRRMTRLHAEISVVQRVTRR